MEFLRPRSAPSLPPSPPVPMSIIDGVFIRHGDTNNDIYRGQVLEVMNEDLRPTSPSTASFASSSSAATGRLGVLAGIVEQAITRWRNSSTSSFSTSSSTTTASCPARRRRRRSSAAERDIVARLKARQETRRVPREFNLYVPPVLQVGFPGILRHEQHLTEEHGMLRTCLLPTILNRLSAAIKASAKLRQPNKSQSSGKHTILSKGTELQSSSIPGRREQALSDLHRTRWSAERSAEGSSKYCNHDSSSFSPLDSPNESKGQQPAWWLDVSNPTNEDMRALGKLLHLHPLTLEDILSRDPREKLELFPKLGYYFIVFKAMENEKTRHNDPHQDGDSPLFAHDGIIGEDLIYLVVLRGGTGLCTFHFTDISEHLDHVRDKILLMGENLKKSSDWIAHGILDSVVDSFYPLLYEIENEAGKVQDAVFADNIGKPGLFEQHMIPEKVDVPQMIPVMHEKLDSMDGSTLDEKPLPSMRNRSSVKTSFHLLPAIYLRRVKSFIHLPLDKVRSICNGKKAAQISSSTLTIHRMARTRRLVTTLTRILAAKSDLIAQIRKRLMTKEEWTLGSDPELYIHMGDIIDHILTLQQGLAHYEKILSDSHSIYLRQLHILAWMTKADVNKAAIILTTVSVSILSIQIVIGVCSLNVTMPTNGSHPGDRYDIFGIVIAITIVILSGFVFVVRCMWLRAGRKVNVL